MGPPATQDMLPLGPLQQLIHITLLNLFSYTPDMYIYVQKYTLECHLCTKFTVHCTELEINFQESEYIFSEDYRGSSIILQLKEVQNSFTVTLHPVSITEARNASHFNVSAFVASVPAEAKATPGKEVIPRHK